MFTRLFNIIFEMLFFRRLPTLGHKRYIVSMYRRKFCRIGLLCSELFSRHVVGKLLEMLVIILSLSKQVSNQRPIDIIDN